MHLSSFLHYDKVPGQSKGRMVYFGSQFQSVVHHEQSHGDRSVKQLAGHAAVWDRERWMDGPHSLSPFYSSQDPSS